MSNDHMATSVSDGLEGRAPVQDETTVDRFTDEAAIRDLYRGLMEGWNRGSGAGFASVFAEEGDLVAFDGMQFEGRAEIAPFQQELFDKWMKGTRLVGRVKSMRFLSPEVALMHAVGVTVMRGKSEPSPERDSIQTLVSVRQDGEWLFAAFHNTRLRPIGRNLVAFVLWTLSGLLWKVFGPNVETMHE